MTDKSYKPFCFPTETEVTLDRDKSMVVDSDNLSFDPGTVVFFLVDLTLTGDESSKSFSSSMETEISLDDFVLTADFFFFSIFSRFSLSNKICCFLKIILNIFYLFTYSRYTIKILSYMTSITRIKKIFSDHFSSFGIFFNSQ